MPLYKFGDGDLFYNQIKAHPSSSFFIYDSKIFYNNKATEPGSFVANATNVPVGHVNLFEYNVDRGPASDLTLTIGPSSSIATGSDGQRLGQAGPTGPNVRNTGIIYPWVYKGFNKVAFKGIKRANFVHNYMQGDVVTGSYQLSSSITRQRYLASHNFNDANLTGSALKNSLSYASRLGPHYDFPSGSSAATNVVQVPTIFYGSKIKKGSVDLKFYITGTVVGRLKDSRHDGALIQSEGIQSSGYDDQIAGVVLYNEGFIVLTGSWNLHSVWKAGTGGMRDRDYLNGEIVEQNASWLHFAMGANDNVTGSSTLSDNVSASFSLDLAGTHKIPNVTMLAHANKGELNYSNNLTYISASQSNPGVSGTYQYIEPEKIIKNTHSSSYADPTGSLVKTTYITKVGIYDEKKKLIGIASLAKPVKKTEDRDLTFKLKLDI